MHCAGGVQCPLVTNFHPDGAEIGSSVDVLACLDDVDFLVIVLCLASINTILFHLFCKNGGTGRR